MHVFDLEDEKTLKITAPTYDAAKNRVYFQTPTSSPQFWVGDITPQMWAFEIGGHPQLAFWLKHRTWSPISHDSTRTARKRYDFSRAITQDELQTFLRICWAISETLRIQNDLTAVYADFHFTVPTTVEK